MLILAMEFVFDLSNNSRISLLFLSLTYSVRLMVTTPSNSWWLSFLIKNEIVNHLSASISLPVLPSPLDDACILKSVEYLPVSPNFTLCPFTSTTGEVWLVVCNFLKLFVILSFDTVKTRKHLVPSNMGKLMSSETFTSSAKGILLIAADTLPNEYVPTPPALLPASWRVFSGRKPFSVLRSPFSVLRFRNSIRLSFSLSCFLFSVFGSYKACSVLLGRHGEQGHEQHERQPQRIIHSPNTAECPTGRSSSRGSRLALVNTPLLQDQAQISHQQKINTVTAATAAPKKEVAPAEIVILPSIHRQLSLTQERHY